MTWDFTTKTLETLRWCKSQGMNLERSAKYLGVCPKTLHRRADAAGLRDKLKATFPPANRASEMREGQVDEIAGGMQPVSQDQCNLVIDMSTITAKAATMAWR